VVSRAFLESEWRRALGGQTTVDCRWEGCYDCGACGLTLSPDLAGEPASDPDVAAIAAGPPAESGERVVRGGPVSYLLGFAVGGRGVYLGHLDTVEILRRAVRRAGGRLALSAGLRPKAQLAVVLPRGVGVGSCVELCQFALATFPPEDFTERLDAALPPGFSLVSLTSYHNRRAAAARVVGARYRAVALLPAGVPNAPSLVGREALEDAARRYTCSETVVVERIRLGQRRSIDVRTYVDRLALQRIPEGIQMDYRARVTPLGTVRPEEMVRVLGLLLGIELAVASVERTAIDLGGC
jgi:radical SAM-linked protein